MARALRVSPGGAEAVSRIDVLASALDLLSEVRVVRAGLDKYSDRLDRMEALGDSA